MDSAYVIAGVQVLLLILLSVDRWVHRVTGRPSLEARVKTLEGYVTLINDKASEHHSLYTAKIISLEGDVRELRTTLVGIVKSADNLERRFENRR